MLTRDVSITDFAVEVFTTMSYVESNLLPGETIVYKARLHPIIYANALTLLLGAGVCFLYAIITTLEHGNSLVTARVGYIGIILLIVAAISGVAAYIMIATSEFVITDRRVLIKTGWINRSSLEVLLPKVEGIQVDQGILGRLFNYGTITVHGTGGTDEPFPNIAAPLEFRRQVQELIPQSV
jgi:uncharacterized membrane protein YdbT with pleckstrin-like domain